MPGHELAVDPTKYHLWVPDNQYERGNYKKLDKKAENFNWLRFKNFKKIYKK